MRKTIAHLIWLAIAAMHVVLFGVSSRFDGAWLAVALVFDFGALYLVSVALPSLVCDLTAVASAGDVTLRARFGNEEAVAASSISLSIVLFIIKVMPDLMPSLEQSTSYFLLLCALTFAVRVLIAFARRQRGILLSAAVGVGICAVAAWSQWK